MTNFNYNQQPQGGYNQQQQGGQQQGGQRNNGFDNHVEVQVIGRMVTDPTSEQKGEGYLAQGKIAINHRTSNGEAKTDYWFVEVWGNQNAMTKHNFLTQHCPKGRKVFITGTPELRQRKKDDGNYTYFPTIKINTIVGLEGGNDNGGGQQQQQPSYNQQQQQPPSGQYAPPNQAQIPNYAPPANPAYGQQPPSYGQQQQQQQQGGYPPATPVQPNGGAPSAFPPNVPGAYPQNVGPMGAPVGAPAGAPNGGYPGVPIPQG